MTIGDRLASGTGVNRGIGHEIRRQLGRTGVEVVLGARDPETAQAAADVLATEGVSVSTATLDVTSPEPIRSAVEGIECDHDRLDILANNAGVFLDKNDAAETIDLDRIRRTMEINTYGSILLCQPRCP